MQPLTGYLRSGVTDLAAKKNYPVYLAAIATQYDHISTPQLPIKN